MKLLALSGALLLAFVSAGQALASGTIDDARAVAAEQVKLLDGTPAEKVQTTVQSTDGNQATIVGQSAKTQCTFELVEDAQKNRSGWVIRKTSCAAR